jgi:putative hemolysin
MKPALENTLIIPQVLIPRQPNIAFSLEMGRFQIKTVHLPLELKKVFSLRYQTFHVEMAGLREDESGLDQDEFDEVADHVAIFDKESGQVLASCRLICSRFSDHFYSEQEFDCQPLLRGPEIKVELGRVCVRNTYRKSILMALLWKGIAEYIVQTKSDILFGCGSIPTLDPEEAAKLYLHFREHGQLTAANNITVKEKYRSAEFEESLSKIRSPLGKEDKEKTEALIPSLCRSYFDMGCRVLSLPAFDHEFKCIDFLISLDLSELSPRVKKRMFGVSTP